METTQIPVAVFILQPPLRSALVALSPEEFGYGKNIDGEKAPKESIKFGIDGRYEAFDEDIANMLRKHIGNTAKGGDVFFEADNEAFRHARALENEIPASMPEGGLTEEDGELLNALDKLATKNLPPPATKGAVEKIKRAVDRFRVAELKVPAAEQKPLIIRARAAELLEILAEQGIAIHQES